MRNRYVLEYLRDGVVVRHATPWEGRADRRAARRNARVFTERLPIATESWGHHIGWMIRVLDRENGNLIVNSYEHARRPNGRDYVRSL